MSFRPNIWVKGLFDFGGSMEKLYHVSNIPNLKILEPHVSSHGKPYVYATKNLAVALLFGSSKSHGDFDGMYGGGYNEKPYFYEGFEGAFEERFKGESCYIYEVDPTTFRDGITSYPAEVVSEVAVKVLDCRKVDDLYENLQNLIRNGELDFKAYSNDKDYQKMMREHIKSRIELFEIDKNTHTTAYKFCKEKYKNILEEVIKSRRG